MDLIGRRGKFGESVLVSLPSRLSLLFGGQGSAPFPERV
jgi:hypothetical protein